MGLAKENAAFAALPRMRRFDVQNGAKPGIADPDKVLRHMVFISIGLILGDLPSDGIERA